MTGSQYIAQVNSLMPGKVVAYLETHGWHEEADEGRYGRHISRFVRTLPGSREPIEAVVPIDDLSNRQHLFFEVLGSIQTIEKRAMVSILEDIQKELIHGTNPA